MFRIISRFDKLEFNKNEWTERTKKQLETQMRQGLREMLRVVIQEVPVYTGMARGSLMPVGKFLRIAIPISPDPIAQYKHPGKNPDAGAALTSFEFVTRGISPQFTLDIGTLHYQLNEFRRSKLKLRHPTPWNSFKKGRRAYVRYLKNNLLRRVTRLTRYISRQRAQTR